MELVCGSCQLGKYHKLPFLYSHVMYNQYFDIVYVYVRGPTLVPSVNGMRIFVLFVINSTRF